jgi:hypothetical protein
MGDSSGDETRNSLKAVFRVLPLSDLTAKNPNRIPLMSAQAFHQNKPAMMWSAVAVALAALVAFFTNPDQAAHLKAIKETVALKQPGVTITDTLLPMAEYHNYLIFSTTTWSDYTLTRGYFARVDTTNAIGIFYGVPPK